MTCRRVLGGIKSQNAMHHLQTVTATCTKYHLINKYSLRTSNQKQENTKNTKRKQCKY